MTESRLDTVKTQGCLQPIDNAQCVASPISLHCTVHLTALHRLSHCTASFISLHCIVYLTALHHTAGEEASNGRSD
ncbi:MAG: hypothetical protein ACON4H_02215 [Rubripirellula sp.]